MSNAQTTPPVPPASVTPAPPTPRPEAQPPGEIGGPKGPEPTRFGDWETNGRCSDF
ncbi:MAG: succinate dehydrogenase assembly factor 4 [Rhodospirillales bacterium]